MDALTVFVVDGPRGASVLSLVQSWTKAGILEPSLWVAPDGVVPAEAGPPAVTATYVHATGYNDVDLFAHIGRFRLDLVRVVVAHLVVDGQESSDQASLVWAGRTIATAIEWALPRRHDGGATGGSRLFRAVVVVPASGTVHALANVFEPAWEVNAVISPEDRPDIDRSSVFVRHPGNFDGHAAAALSAVGGVLRGVGAGVLDDQTTDSSSRQADAVVARVSIRTVVGEDVLGRISARVMDGSDVGSEGPAQLLSWARPASDPGLVAQSAADFVLTSAEWAPTPMPSPASPSTTTQGFWAALGTAALFNLKTVGAVTSWILTRGRARVERGATDAIVGGKAGVLVTLGPRPVEDFARASGALLERERAAVDQAMRLQASRLNAPPATTWTRLRGLALGLVDGGSLGDFPEPRQASKRELLPGPSVVVQPASEWVGREGTRVSGDDPLRMREQQATFREQTEELKQAVREARNTLKAAEAERAEAEAERAAAEKEREKARSARRSSKRGTKGAPETPSAGDEPTEEALPPLQPDDATLEKCRAELASVRELYAAVRADSDSFDAWFATCSPSLLWKVGDDVGVRARENRARQDEVANRAESDEPPPSTALKDAQRNLTRWWSWTVPIWLVLSGAAVYLAYGELPARWQEARLGQEQMVDVLVALFVLAAVILAFRNHRFYKAVRLYEWQVEQRLDRIHREKAVYVHSGQEAARLELMYDALRDWVRILGEVVYRPWSRPQSDYEDLPDDVIAALPASMGVARQSTSEDAIPSRVMLSAYRTLYPEGWASQHFERAYEAWEGIQDGAPDEGYRAVDVDAMHSPMSPRRRLREFWETGEARKVLSDAAHDRLMTAVHTADVILPERVVGRIGPYTDGTSGPEPQFFRATATESTTFATELFSPRARQARLHYVARSTAWLPASAVGLVRTDAVEIRESAGPTAVRVDVSRRIAVADLLPFFDASTSDGRLDEPVLDQGEGVGWH